MNYYDLIKDSNNRSKVYGISKKITCLNKSLKSDEINVNKLRNKALIDVASYYGAILLKTINNKPIIILTDSNGYILNMQGNREIIDNFYKLNIKVGTDMKEEAIGTNSIGLAIKTNFNIQIREKEHYIELLHNLICSTSLMYDSYGELMGTLSLLSTNINHNDNSSSLIEYTSKIIESELNKNIKNSILSGKIINKSIKDKDTRYEFEDIIENNDIMKEIINTSKIIANSKSTILIEGESGTGKEILAQSIHNYSNRKNNQFVAINCGAIPANIIESELFGYEEGSFTGARKGGKIGKFEIANNGTLFLDEVGDMPLELQVHLLRVLQEGKICRVGSNKEIKINVRIIAATNKDLKNEIKKGNFREDLYYRLCVLPIKLPPLRERKSDIDKLIKYFLNKKSKELGKDIPRINDTLYLNLLNFNWPGNIRQLENIIENIVNLNGNLSIDIFSDYHSSNISDFINFKKQENIKEFNLNSNEMLIITEAITKNDYNLTKTASVLGISRNTLYNKIKKYKIKL